MINKIRLSKHKSNRNHEEKISKSNYLKIRNFCKQNNLKNFPQDKRLVSLINKKLLPSNKKNTKNHSKGMNKEHEPRFIKDV